MAPITGKEVDEAILEETIKKILVLYVGGTIGMTPNESGVLSPVPNIFCQKLRTVGQLCDLSYVDSKLKHEGQDVMALPLFKKKYRIVYKIEEFDPVMDSSCMGLQDWKKITTSIKENFWKYNGFVILHGTDTLAYTASALSFMFENLSKTVILTGSQLPIYELGSDGVRNLQYSLIFAGVYQISEVCVFFGSSLLKGNRTTKVSSHSFEGFQSPKIDPLAIIGCEINFKYQPHQQITSGSCSVQNNLNPNVTILMMYPEISEKLVKTTFEPPTEGVVILTYGSGNINAKKHYLIEAIKNAVAKGILVVNCSQCFSGSVRSIYETNKILSDIGVISAFDMTMEATYTKLMYVISMKNLTYSEKKAKMESNLRGELTN